MKKPTDIGTNRTGIAVHPVLARAAVRGAVEGDMDQADIGELIATREKLAKEARPVGTMPPPANLRGVAKTAMQALRGVKGSVFLDKLGERLAFERTGTRLYEALLVKLEAAAPHPGRPTREALSKIRSDEYRHFAMLSQAMVQLGGDPTAITPAANVSAVASSGLPQVLNDPRTTLNQCLNAILTAELVDNDAWQVLADMAEKLGQRELAVKFREALAEEAEHLELVREWLANGVEGETGLRDTTVRRPAAVRRPTPATRGKRGGRATKTGRAAGAGPSTRSVRAARGGRAAKAGHSARVGRTTSGRSAKPARRRQAARVSHVTRATRKPARTRAVAKRGRAKRSAGRRG